MLTTTHTVETDLSRSTAGENNVLVNHPTLYFNGNVILKCGRILFCVHRAVLSEHSRVFRDIFTHDLLKPGEHFRGCALLRLSDDVDLVAILLRIIYTGV